MSVMLHTLVVAFWKEQEPMACLIIKNGSYAKCWRQLRRYCPGGATFIHLYRDPRAVISSKLLTRRPYAKAEVMAWGGALLASVRWRLYSVAMRRAVAAGVNIVEVKYEAFVANPELEMTRVADLLGTRQCSSQHTRQYSVPAAEASIHQLVPAGTIVSGFEERWRHDLSERDVSTIECVCQSEMLARGYLPKTVRSLPMRLWLAGLRSPETAYLVLRHIMVVLGAKASDEPKKN